MACSFFARVGSLGLLTTDSCWWLRSPPLWACLVVAILGFFPGGGILVGGRELERGASAGLCGGSDVFGVKVVGSVLVRFKSTVDFTALI